MKNKLIIKSFSLMLLIFLSYFTHAQTLTLNNDIQRVSTLTNTTATLTGTSELHITGTGDPISNSIINLNSPDAWFFMDNIMPSQLVSTFLSRVRVNNVSAILDQNVRVVQYVQGAVVIPHAADFAPLQIFLNANFSGSSTNLNQYTAYNSASLGQFSGSISSFKLKRGYMATLAQNEDGTGVSKVYIAQDGDLNVGVLAGGLNDSVKFVRVFPWRWTTKKGLSGDPSPNLKNQWDYNWNISKNSSLDKEYVAIRQTRWWPGLTQDWKARGINHLLGYNEPDSTSQANILVGDAVWSWPDLLGTGLRVGSPAVTDGGLNWLYSFMNQAAAENKRVDFVAVHYYRCFGNAADPAGAANQFYNFLKGVYDTTKKPLWITEWNNGANWTSCADPTAAQQQATVAAMLNMLDTTPFVERYAFYNWVEDSRRVSWDDGSLTAAGNTYRDKISPLSYVQEIPAAGTNVQANFMFDGNALDSSANGHHAMQIGARNFVSGRVGQAINLDGVNDYLQLSPQLGSSTDFTFAAWIYWNGGAIWQRIFDLGDGTTKYMFLTPSSYSNTLRFAIKNGGAEQIINHTAALPVNSWAHVAVTLSGNTGKLFVNGAVVASNTAITINPVDLGSRLNYLGKSQFAPDPLFAGSLDDVRFVGNALSDSEIATLAVSRSSSSSSSRSSSISSSRSSSRSSSISSSRSSSVSSSRSSSRSSSISSSRSSSRSSAGGALGCGICNWYGTQYPTCCTTTSGWGWESNMSCISPSTCASQ